MTAPALLGSLLDGKFQIEKALASGASGDVYEAMHLGLGARVAVKVLRPGIPETADIRRKRFLREAQVAARIHSDHVVRVFDIVAPEDGPTYIVMELLVGETLAEHAARVGRLAIADAVDYVLQAAKPLAEMHDAGIVHRDVKPSNLFLSREKDGGGKARVKLIDFGVAAFRQPLRRGESSLTLAETVIGTPRYMAPEQVLGSKDVDARADVWALGVTLYVLLAGRPPFDAATPLAVMNQIERTEPPPLAQHRPDVTPALAAVVHRCLAKDPSARPADARALVLALAPFARQEAPLDAARTSPTMRRKAAVVALLVVGAASAVAASRGYADGVPPLSARALAEPSAAREATPANPPRVPVHDQGGAAGMSPAPSADQAPPVQRAEAAPAFSATATSPARAAIVPRRPPMGVAIRHAPKNAPEATDDDRIE